jgi:hypothetical protein
MRLSPEWGLWLRSVEAQPPPDWFPAPPDFVGIGVQKAGTTWWYRMIEAHPQIFTRHWQKERHYLDRFANQDFTEESALRYSELFYRPLGGKSGEWTPGYICEFWVPRLLKQAAPETKILVLLREPVARYLSGVRHGLHIERLKLKVAQRDAFERGLYFAQLALYLRHFPAEQILLLQYEHCIADPLTQLRRTFEFLEVDPVDFVPPNLTVAFNESRGPRYVAPDHIIEQLVDLYAPDVAQLKATWPELDLTVWPRFDT